MTSGPDGVLFSRDHLWVRITDGTARVGLTDFAQETLGDIVDISVPDANYRVTAGQACGDIESTKSVNDLVAPVSSVVTAINTDLDERPELVNTDPYGGGWLIDVRTRSRRRCRRPAVGGRPAYLWSCVVAIGRRSTLIWKRWPLKRSLAPWTERWATVPASPRGSR